MLHTEARPCQWAMPSPRRTRGIETHNAIADDAGIGDMPLRKRTIPQTQPACAGNQRLVPDADFLLTFVQNSITRDEWIAPKPNSILSAPKDLSGLKLCFKMNTLGPMQSEIG
jgi:hypothetical protein